jgi:hypothetical protein
LRPAAQYHQEGEDLARFRREVEHRFHARKVAALTAQDRFIDDRR